jgi:uncharacterized protein
VRSRPLPKARFAAILLLLLFGSVVAFLVACPPPADRKAQGTPPARSPDLPSHSPASSRWRAAHPEHPRPEKPGLLAVIIDDAGYSLPELQAFLDLPGVFTIAVLPNLPHSRDAAQRVLAAGKDLILHCPMEATGGENPGPGALFAEQGPREVEALLAAAFATVPGALGMNNHMGSKATADAALMATVIGYLKREGKFYVDSRTTTATVGPRIARELGVPFLERDIFIDAATGADEIAAAFSQGIAEARTRGSAVIIGHVQNPGVVAILRAGANALPGQGVRFARLADVMKEREGEPAR